MKIILTKDEQKYLGGFYKNVPKEFNLKGNIHFKKKIIDVIFNEVNEILRVNNYHTFSCDNFDCILRRRYPYIVVTNKKNRSMSIYDCEERMYRDKKIYEKENIQSIN